MIRTSERLASFCAVVLGTLVLVQLLPGQPPGPERRERGGGRGGAEGARGGPGIPPGGPEGTRGGPPGGGMMGGPMDFLARLDVNGNGMLDPEESQGRARMFLERTGLDLSRPIPLDHVARAFEEMRNRRMEERGGGPQRGGRDRDEDRGGERRGERREEEPRIREVPPLVPGFGESDLFDPVPAFGDSGERFAVKMEEQDIQEAQRTLARYDTNQDGVLDPDEIRNARWGGDPLLTDRNRDGRLALTELALRYAIRRVENAEQPAAARPASRAGGGQATAPGERGAAERPASEAREGNRDGDRGGQAPERWFTRRDGQGEGNAQDQESRPVPTAANGRLSYRIMTPAERLATYEGLPDWFARVDASGDGQVSMAEYATNWSDEVVADYAQFDLNGDGIITSQECLRAVEAGAVQGMPPPGAGAAQPSRENGGASGRLNDRASTRGSGAAPQAPSDTKPVAAATRPQPGGDATSERYVKYAVDMIKRYDTNGDGVLNEDEWSKMNKDHSFADVDGDGRITPHELAAALSRR